MNHERVTRFISVFIQFIFSKMKRERALKITLFMLISIGLFILFDGNLYLLNKWFYHHPENGAKNASICRNLTKTNIFELTQCFRATKCDHIELSFYDNPKFKMYLSSSYINEKIHQILVQCPEGCSNPIPKFSHHLNIANFMYLNFENGQLVYVTLSDEVNNFRYNITSSDYRYLRKVILSCLV
jgi:hypothetical protein